MNPSDPKSPQADNANPQEQQNPTGAEPTQIPQTNNQPEPTVIRPDAAAGAEQPGAPPQADPAVPTAPTSPVTGVDQSNPVTPMQAGSATPQQDAPKVQGPSMSDSQMKSSGSKKKLSLAAIIAIVVGLLVAGSAAAYFGIIVPNKPENVWKSALSNTSKGYDKFVSYAEEQEEVKGYSFDGSFKVDSSEFTTDGTLEGVGYENNSTFKVDVGLATTRINVEGMTIASQNSDNPDVYFKVSGIKGLGAMLGGDFGTQVDSLDSQWIAVDHTLLDNLEKQALKETSEAPEPTKEDVIAIARTIGEVNQEYLFSTDESKAVLKVAENVGKEDLDGRSTYHYKVGYDKENLKTYVTTMKDRLKDTKLTEFLGDQTLEEYLNYEDMVASIDELDESETADVWVDMSTKLVRKVRFSEKDNAENYLDIGLNYNGGDEYPFVISTHSKEDDVVSTMDMTTTLNTKEDTVGIDANFNVGGDEDVSGNFKLNAKPHNQPVEVTKPANAKSINEVIGLLMGGYYGGTSGSLYGDSSTLGAFDINDLMVQ